MTVIRPPGLRRVSACRARTLPTASCGDGFRLGPNPLPAEKTIAKPEPSATRVATVPTSLLSRIDGGRRKGYQAASKRVRSSRCLWYGLERASGLGENDVGRSIGQHQADL